MKEYSHRLAPENKDSCIAYANAEICFANGDFNTSLENITKTDVVYFDMKLSIKALQIMNYYELNDYDSFLYCLT